MFQRLILLLLALCLAYPAWGEEGPKKGAKPEPGTSVDVRLMAPMSQDGNLLGYAYITAKMVCSSPGACITVREKFAFIQDAFVRELHAKPIGQASDPKKVDSDQFASRLTAAAKRIMGSDKVRTMFIVEEKFAPLHPSDSTAAATPPQQTASGNTTAGAGEAPKNASSEGATSKPAAGPPH
jgi:hypothetical protein